MQLNGKEKEFTEEQDKELFRCLTCSLGSFGVITSVRLKVVPQFDLELNRYYLSYNSFLETFKTHYSSSDHFYYLWYPHTNGGIANHLTRVSPRKISPKKSIFSRFTSWIRSSLIGKIIDWFFVVFLIHFCLDHYLLEFLFFVSLWIPRLVIYINRFYLRLDRRSYHEIARCDRLLNFDTVIRQYATEWAVPLDEAVSCLTQLHQWIDKHYSRTPVHYPIVVRFSCSENSSYLSPGFERATCWINVASTRSYGISHSQHRPLFEAFETIFQQHKGRPHWAKEHPLTGKNLRQVYPQWDLFHEKRQQFDPNNLFVNDYLKKIFIDD
jgi:L-gulonolactone oxidase